MRYINGWVESIVLHQQWWRIFLQRVDIHEENRILYYKRFIFEDMDEPYLKGNKEGNRPHYYCFEDSVSGLYWMIPLSSRIDKYKKIVENKKKAGKPCDIIHIVKLDDDRESAFLIRDMFPITDEYIEREYTIAGNHLMLTSEHTVKEIEQKARKVLGMLKRGVKFTPTQPDVMKIIEKLTEK